MSDKISTVKNPLTVIAIFAGTAEISGTAVLPLLGEANQHIYLWFLMLFPFSLIALFFITLNWNYKVLYAPSDFKDEDNFVNLLKKQSTFEQNEQMANIKNDIVEETGIKDVEISDSETVLEETVDEVTTDREKRLERDKITRNIVQQQMREYQLAEKLVLDKLEKDLAVSIERNMKIEIENIKNEFDGIIRKGDKLTVIETKYMRKKNAWNYNQWNSFVSRLNNIYDSLSEEQKNGFLLIFAVVTDEIQEEMYNYIQNRLAKVKLNMIVQVYDFDTLVNEMMA